MSSIWLRYLPCGKVHIVLCNSLCWNIVPPIARLLVAQNYMSLPVLLFSLPIPSVRIISILMPLQFLKNSKDLVVKFLFRVLILLIFFGTNTFIMVNFLNFALNLAQIILLDNSSYSISIVVDVLLNINATHFSLSAVSSSGQSIFLRFQNVDELSPSRSISLSFHPLFADFISNIVFTFQPAFNLSFLKSNIFSFIS